MTWSVGRDVMLYWKEWWEETGFCWTTNYTLGFDTSREKCILHNETDLSISRSWSDSMFCFFCFFFNKDGLSYLCFLINNKDESQTSRGPRSLLFQKEKSTRAFFIGRNQSGYIWSNTHTHRTYTHIYIQLISHTIFLGPGFCTNILYVSPGPCCWRDIQYIIEIIVWWCHCIITRNVLYLLLIIMSFQLLVVA